MSGLVLAGKGQNSDKLLPVIDGEPRGTRAPETQTDSLKTVVIDCIVGQIDTKILWVFEWIVGKAGFSPRSRLRQTTRESRALP